MTGPVARLSLLLLLLLTGCGGFYSRSPDAGAAPRYVVGRAYQAGAAWFYPREDFFLDATGLAITLPDRTGPTADGEAWNPRAMTGAHDTLQLPAITRVTNLENGLQALIRINDRGPASPGRLIGLTPHAADRLGMKHNAATRVRVQVESEPSQALRDLLQGSPAVAVASAPREGVSSEELAPPPGLQRSTLRRIASAPPGAPPGTATRYVPAAAAQGSLPDTVIRVPISPCQLWLRLDEFGQAGYAERLRARLAGLGASIERVRQGRSETFRVRAGPFTDVSQADGALDRAVKAGVTDAHIVVE